jgi:hypothetical protein
MRRTVLIAVGVYMAALAVFAVAVGLPFLQKKRDIPAEVPSPPALVATSLDVIPPGGRLCMRDVAISAQAQQMRVALGTYFRPGPALGISVRAPGYDARARVPAGYKDNSTLIVPLRRPPSSRLVTVCVRNTGTRKLALYAAADRAQSRVVVTIDGRHVSPTPALSFNEARAVSIAASAGVTAGRIAVFRGFLDHSWIVWLLALLALVAAPVLIALGLARSEI